MQRRFLFRGTAVLLGVMLAAVFLEMGLALTQFFPALGCAPLVKNFVRNFYAVNWCLPIQYDPRCSRYDPDLFYTLRPGTCTFSLIEFSNRYRVNRLGLRDDEESLSSPEIVVLGDSYSMGWGVRQEETYAQLLERATGMKVLNAAVSSYGTVREMRMLSRLDTSRLKYLIVQYCRNDDHENRSLFEGSYVKGTEESYLRRVAGEEARLRYYPFKYVRKTVEILTHTEPLLNSGRFTSAGKNPPGDADTARRFLHALLTAADTPLSGVKIIVFEPSESFLIPWLREEIAEKSYPQFVRDMEALGIGGALPRDAYYPLDGHLTARGHRLVAETLLTHLRNSRPINGPAQQRNRSPV